MKLSEMNAQSTNHMGESGAKAQAKKNIQDAYDELKGYSSDELMARLAKEINQQKSSGTFDYEGLCESIDKMKIYLPEQVYQNMKRIIDGLK